MPSCLNGGHYQHHQPQAGWTTTSAHGSFARKGLCCPFPHRSYDPIRQSRRLPPISLSLVIRWVFAQRPGLGCPRDLPCFPSALLPHVPPSLRRQKGGGHVSGLSPAPVAFPILGVGRLLHLSRHRFPSGNLHDAAMFALCCGPQSC